MSGAPPFAPDRHVPHRDELLDRRLLAARLDRLLGANGSPKIKRVEHVRVKYRVGRGLGAVLRVHSASGQYIVSARSFEPGLAARNFERALVNGPSVTGPLNPVSYAPDLETVFWTFPSDRRIGSLSLVNGPNDDLTELVGRPCAPDLVGYVPEKAATARCADARARTLAYVKVYAGDEGRRTRSVLDSLSAALDPSDGRLRLPNALVYDEGRHALVMTPIKGQTLAARRGDFRRSGLAELGAALALLHAAPPPPLLTNFQRLTPDRLRSAGEQLGSVRPDVAVEARRVAGSLASSFRDADELVCLHGDVHRKNSVLLSSGIALIDLDQMGLGDPAADLGSLLAELRYRQCVSSLSEAGRRELTEDLLDGYRSVRELPGRNSLCWHTAASLLAERALRSVTRMRPAGLEHLTEIVGAAWRELSSLTRSGHRPRATSSTPPRPALLLHCQHARGLGHLTRSLALAGALVERFRVVVLSGGPLPPHLTAPPGVKVLQLPALTRDPQGRLIATDRRRSVDRVKVLRCQMIVDAVRRIRPAVIVVELFPFGRRAFAGEILAMLEAARELPGPPSLVTCSVRDILVGRGDEQAAFDEWACGLANAHFDAILMHSDPSFARLEESFRPRTPLRVPVLYTGFVATDAPAPLPRDQRARRVVVSAGGGRVGEALLGAAIDAQPDLWRRERIAMRLIAGPFLGVNSWRELRSRAKGREGLELRRAVADLGLELRNAMVSVSQCGYNTAIDILQAGVPALVVPFTAPGEDEQTRRGRRLAVRGAVRVLDPRELDGPALVREITELARATTPAVDLHLDGARASAEALSKLLAASTSTRSASA